MFKCCDAVGCGVCYKLQHVWSIYEIITRTSPMQTINRNASLLWLPHNKSLKNLIVLFCGITLLVIYSFYPRKTTITDRRNKQRMHDRSAQCNDEPAQPSSSSSLSLPSSSSSSKQSQIKRRENCAPAEKKDFYPF